MTMTPEEATRFAANLDRLVGAVEEVLLGKNRVVRLAFTAFLSEGHLLLDDVPGHGQDLARAGDGPVGRRLEQPRAVHARPAAGRHHGRHRLRPAQRCVRVPSRSGLREHRARRRDQPREPEDAVRPARGHGGGPGHRRRADAPGGASVHGHRDPEPRGAGRHLPPARGAARPVPDAHLDRVPRPRVHDPDPRGRRPARARPARRRRSSTPRRSSRWPRSPAPCTSTRRSTTTCRDSSTRRAPPGRCASA